MAELEQQQQLREKLKEAGQQLKEQSEKLNKFGGFDIIETTVKGVENLNPKKRARKEIFLTEDQYKEDRKALKRRLELWHELLSGSDDLATMMEQCEERSKAADEILNKNLSKAIEATKNLERSYRTVALFFRNTEQDKVKNVSIMNAAPEQLTDLDVTTFIDAVEQEFKQAYDRLDLRDNYSMLVVPGFLKSNAVLEKWAKIAHNHKVMMLTDFRNLDSPDDVMDMFQAANLSGGDVYRSNVIMTCNWLVGRQKYEELGEEEELHVPPSAALAGKIYKTLMSQVTAGKKHGGINEVEGVKFPLKKSEISSLEKMGLVPMVNEYGKVMAFSAKTLFNGDNIGLQTYSVVRVFDWVSKVLVDFLNRRAFENFNANTKRDIRQQIVKFLDSISGPNNLIQKFKILRFEQDPKQKDRIFLDIHISPYFPAKTFVMKLDGQKGDDPDSPEWNTEYEQN
ncbi:MAG: type VI secretion system contractile sheath protein TssC [Bacteroidetes bacterium]|nr:MAG: type VI secretion system contractile sheath protein TssC [Bacteroidota bacterium]